MLSNTQISTIDKTPAGRRGKELLQYLSRQRNELPFLLALIFVATLLRLLLIANNWPTTNSDEANMALLARHVAYNGEWPIFFYGLPYMGPIEGYIAAPLFHLFGPSTFVLRLGLLPFFFLFVLCMYYLTNLLYSRGLAWFTVMLLCFGSADIINRQVRAVGEYPEIVFFAAIICLLVVWLARTLPPDRSSQPAPRRIFVYGLLGLMVGLALWVDFLILPFIGTGALFLLLFCRRELWSLAGLSLLLGIIIGAFPLLLYNITAPLNQNSFAVLLSIHSSGGKVHLLQQIVNTLLISLPSATGYNPRCLDTSLPYLHPAGSPVSIPCLLLQGGWSAGYLLLLTLATLFAGRLIWQQRTRLLKLTEEHEERQHLLRQCGRLMLLISALGTLFLYVISPVAATVPDPTARYLIGLMIAFPAVLWPIWKNLPSAFKRENGQKQFSIPFPALVRRGLLFLILLLFMIGTCTTFADISGAQAAYAQQDALVQQLLKLGATRIYSEYWTCNRLTFQSQEKIICSTLNEQLQPGFDRYAPYRTIVRSAPHPAYIFPNTAPQIRTLDDAIKSGKIITPYRRLTFQNYVFYLPES